MKCRYSNRRSQRGIALVITLVMLAVVTVMAIVFLGVSRRERASVKVAEDLNTANAIAEAALERAKAEAIARMSLNGSKLYYELFNSTNFTKRSFTPQAPTSPADPSNVSYYDNAGNLITGTPYLRMLANLQYDARPPVFVETNDNGGADFRFYLDFNRNRLFETNGLVEQFDAAGLKIGTNVMVGDPEWIGVLERPDVPHSETNRFIGRMAYLVLPVGKTLDLNYIHNQGDPAGDNIIDAVSARNGFTRNQGVGSWEINLAAFLRELNTNTYAWGPASYRFRLGNGALPTGVSFDDARSMLAFRYQGRRSNLSTAEEALGRGNVFNPNNLERFAADQIDNYGDGDLYNIQPGNLIFHPARISDNDQPSIRPWPGSNNTNAFTDLQQLFSMERYSPGFTNRLQRAMRSRDTQDRYTFYRLASQLGVDSTPALNGKLHLLYDNSVGEVTNTFKRWTNALRFFTNAADLMLKASIDRTVTSIVNGVAVPYYQIGDTFVRTNFSLNNIQVYTPPTASQPFATGNEYTSTIHRILQLAVNIYDNMTNVGSAYPYYPTVLRPIYTRTATNLIISGFLEETNGASLTLPVRDPIDFYRTNSTPGVTYSNFYFYGQHLIVGAKKGHPNFNELALESYVEVSRKLEVAKNAPGGTINDTNQMFLVSLFNRWGMETWNSYTSTYPRNVQIAGEVRSKIAIRDLAITNTALPVYYTEVRAFTNKPMAAWAGGAFDVLFDRKFSLLQDVAYSRATGFRATNLVRFYDLEPSPRFQLVTTNDVRFYMIDSNNRIIDSVSFNDLTTVLDLSTNLYALPSPVNQQVSGPRAFNDNMFWDPRPVSPGSLLTVGITNQIAVSSGDIEVDADTWKRYRYNSPDKEGAIAGFRSYLGLGLRPTDPPIRPTSESMRQAPFVPTRRMYQMITWSANDPLVHYMPEDLTRPPNSDKPTNLRIEQPLPPWNIGRVNDKIYRPWGVPADNDPTAYNMTLKDPGIRKSDDWEFPAADATVTTNTYNYPNIGALGRVHRGTPWQTVYLKSVMQYGPTNQVIGFLNPTMWTNWAGSAGTYPMNDWKLLDVFTTAPNENAARGLLSVNQTNRAAWSAVLSGIMVATNAVPNPKGVGPDDGLSDTNTFKAMVIDPATPQIAKIVDSINLARRNQWDVIRNPNPGSNPLNQWLLVPRTNSITGRPTTVFQSLGDVLGAPQLSIQSPFLNTHQLQVRHVLTDRAVEYLPQQILSLLQRDEPRFVVYAFGQSLKPAPRSLARNADFYNLVTNYQITGEVITKTTFRVEGELRSETDPLRAVVESYNLLPPAE